MRARARVRTGPAFVRPPPPATRSRPQHECDGGGTRRAPTRLVGGRLGSPKKRRFLTACRINVRSRCVYEPFAEPAGRALSSSSSACRTARIFSCSQESRAISSGLSGKPTSSTAARALGRRRARTPAMRPATRPDRRYRGARSTRATPSVRAPRARPGVPLPRSVCGVGRPRRPDLFRASWSSVGVRLGMCQLYRSRSSETRKTARNSALPVMAYSFAAGQPVPAPVGKTIATVSPSASPYRSPSPRSPQCASGATFAKRVRLFSSSPDATSTRGYSSALAEAQRRFPPEAWPTPRRRRVRLSPNRAVSSCSPRPSPDR